MAPRRRALVPHIGPGLSGYYPETIRIETIWTASWPSQFPHPRPQPPQINEKLQKPQ